jgi:hypothetical protein
LGAIRSPISGAQVRPFIDLHARDNRHAGSSVKAKNQRLSMHIDRLRGMNGSGS